MNDLKSDLASLRIEHREAPARQRSWWPLVLIVLIVAALGLWLWMPRATVVETSTASVRSGASRSAGSAVMTASGYVVARRKAVVSAKIQGRLSELHVEEASHVREGDVIARLESENYRAQRSRAKAQVQRSEAELDENRRQLRLAESLNRDQVLANDQLEAAQSRVRLAEATLAQSRADLAFAEAQLQDTVIRAPFTGVVVKKMAEVGESVAPIPPGVNLSTSSGAIVALADLATLEVEVDVSESNVAKLRDTQPAEVTVEAFPDRRYRAVLRQIIPTADRTKATVQVKVTILDKDEKLKPEMSAKVNFLEAEVAAEESSSAPPAVTVPETAVTTRDGQPHVFEILDGKARARRIAAGTSQQGQVVVKEGIKGGEIVILNPPPDLKDGDAVKTKR
jgi:RND family efflux transporter MFP subunit